MSDMRKTVEAMIASWRLEVSERTGEVTRLRLDAEQLHDPTDEVGTFGGSAGRVSEDVQAFGHGTHDADAESSGARRDARVRFAGDQDRFGLRLGQHVHAVLRRVIDHQIEVERRGDL